MSQNASTLLNFIAGEWHTSSSEEVLGVHNPATGKRLAGVPMSTPLAVRQPENSAMKRRRGTSASILVSQRQWRFFPSAAGKIASLAPCTARANTQLNSSPKQKLS